MKVAAVLLITLMSVVGFAQRQVPPGSIPGHDQVPPRIPDFPRDPGYPDDHSPWRDGSEPRGGSSCSPDVVEENVSTTDRTLKGLVNSPAFASAATFRSLVSEIVSLRTADTRVAHYFALIGIDSRNSAAVASFVGARSIEPRWISALERNAGLSKTQASVVAVELQSALRGNLQ